MTAIYETFILMPGGPDGEVMYPLPQAVTDFIQNFDEGETELYSPFEFDLAAGDLNSHITVTQAHIDEGIPGDPCACPVWLAIAEVYPDFPFEIKADYEIEEDDD